MCLLCKIFKQSQIMFGKWPMVLKLCCHRRSAGLLDMYESFVLVRLTVKSLSRRQLVHMGVLKALTLLYSTV